MYGMNALGAMIKESPQHAALVLKADPSLPSDQVQGPSKVYYVKSKYTVRDVNGVAKVGSGGALAKGTKVLATEWTTELPGKGSVKYRMIIGTYGTGPNPLQPLIVSAPQGYSTTSRGFVAASGLQTTPPATGKKGTDKTTSPADADKPKDDNNTLLLVVAAAAALYFLTRKK